MKIFQVPLFLKLAHKARRFSAPRGKSLCTLAALILALAPAASHGQALAPAPAPVDIFLDWDFTGIPLEEREPLMSILDPARFNARPKTSEELALHEYHAFAITDPDAFAIQHPRVLTAEEQAEAELARFAILNPIAWQKAVDAAKSKEQLEAEALSLWLMTHPDELAALAEKLKTPAEKQADADALKAITNPVSKPKPLVQPTAPDLVPHPTTATGE